MESPTGAQIARNIELLATEQANRADEYLVDSIKESTSNVLQIDIAEVPRRLINSLSRGSTQVGKDQAIRELQLLLATRSSLQVSPEDAFTRISNQVAENRRMAHKLRSQLSSIRSILKYFDDTRTNTAAAYLSDWQMQERMRLLDQPVRNVDDLQFWTNSIAEFFEEVSRSADQSSSSKRGEPRVSPTAARNYGTILRTFVSRNSYEVLNQRHQSINFSNLNSSSLQTPSTANINDSELTIVLANTGETPFNLKKTWTDLQVSKAELSGWLAIARQIVGENTRIDSIKIKKVSSTGEESLDLQQMDISAIESIVRSLL